MNNISQSDHNLGDNRVIGLVYSAISVLMLVPYGISWFIIKRDKTLYDPAFRLFALNMGCADVQLLTVQGIFPSLACLLPVEIPLIVYKILGAMGADAWYTYATLAQMMSLNRLISVFWPLKTKMIYTTKNTWVIIGLCWIQGWIWMSFYLGPNATLQFSLDEKGMLYDFSKTGTAELFQVNTIFNYAHGLSLCLIYALIYFRIRQKRKQILDAVIANDSKKERKVLVQSCVICSMDLAVIATWAVFQKFIGAKWAIFIATIVALSSAGSTGYMYILMNR
uniref:Vomeronasal type-1 receptor n=1 Tax=Romanomermis culicivorax TaxID=13658 RepID=A0A915KRQ3_ROMCU